MTEIIITPSPTIHNNINQSSNLLNDSSSTKDNSINVQHKNELYLASPKFNKSSSSSSNVSVSPKDISNTNENNNSKLAKSSIYSTESIESSSSSNLINSSPSPSNIQKLPKYLYSKNNNLEIVGIVESISDTSMSQQQQQNKNNISNYAGSITPPIHNQIKTNDEQKPKSSMYFFYNKFCKNNKKRINYFETIAIHSFKLLIHN